MVDLSTYREWDLWVLAETLFDNREPARAAQLLAELVDDEGDAPLSVRLLLARALFASAQLNRAEEVLRRLVADHPVEAYGHLLLGRTLERQSRHGEAAVSLRLAEALEPGISTG